MNMTTKIDTEPIGTRVALHPFLAGMDRAQLALLADCAMATHFIQGNAILQEGEFANRFYLIESGRVVLESSAGVSDRLILETIGSGDLLGWSGCSHHTYGNSVRAQSSQQQPSFSTAQFCGNTARTTIR
jgi:CRP-like cAMP-binding protein